jgi:hypothetical protein
VIVARACVRDRSSDVFLQNVLNEPSPLEPLELLERVISLERLEPLKRLERLRGLPLNF